MRNRTWQGRARIGNTIVGRQSRTQSKPVSKPSQQKSGRAYALAKGISNVIQIVGGQKGLLIPLAHTPFIGLDIVQWKDGEDVLPLAELGRDPGAALFCRSGDHMVDNEKAFGFGLGLDGARRFGFSIADAIKPVTNPIVPENQLDPSRFGYNRLTATGAMRVPDSSSTREQILVETIHRIV